MIPPEADESGEPDKKRARKSRWDPVEEEKPFVDRKRLSELEFLSFYPVWDFRKMARYLSHESKAECFKNGSERVNTVAKCNLC